MKKGRSSLVLQSFGRESEYKRAILTILSFYTYSSLPILQTRVVLFTDQPDYFKLYLSSLPVEYVLLSPEKIKAMRGEIDFLHRMKVALIEEAFQLTDGNLIYADSDTFFTADPEPLMSKLKENQSFMHLWEYEFEELRNWRLPAGQTFRDFLHLIETETFQLTDSCEIKITPKHVSWNAGAMMFHSSHARFIPDVYALTDQFYPASLNHASEQYAFSVILQNNTQLSACDSVIYHYWYRIKKQIIDQFLSKELSPEWAKLHLQQKLEIVKKWTERLPNYFEKHELTIKDNAIQAFNDDCFCKGYRWAAKALFQKPLGSGAFIKDVLYHFKRQITKQ